MSDSVEFEVRIEIDLDPNKVEGLLRTEFERNLGIRVVAAKHVRPLGMTATEAAISFVISLVSSSLVHTYRDQIDAAAKKVGEKTKSVVRVVFRNNTEKPK